MRDRTRALVVATAVTIPLVLGGVVLATRGGDALEGRQNPTPGPPAGEAVVWAVGDGADAERDARALARLIASRRVDRFLYLGDVYGDPSRWAVTYDRTYGALAPRTSPTPGNHEWPNRKGEYLGYWTRVSGRPMTTRYSFELAGWKLISLNSAETTAEGSPQQRWLAEQVQGPGDCRLAYWHVPRFSASVARGDDRSLEPLWRTLSGRARIVLTGHEHNMQRMEPRDGITQFVSGAGGHNHYPVKRRDARFSFLNDDDYGALRLKLSPGRADYAFVGLDERTLDSGTVTCRSA